MFNVEFEYKTHKIFFQAINEDKMRQVCFRFSQKIQIDLNQLYFMYSGNVVNLDLSIEQIINKADKERNMMSIIVTNYNTISGNNNRILSTNIICPICKENARFEMKDFRIKITYFLSLYPITFMKF